MRRLKAGSSVSRSTASSSLQQQPAAEAALYEPFVAKVDHVSAYLLDGSSAHQAAHHAHQAHSQFVSQQHKRSC
jgi:hypothetical protein